MAININVETKNIFKVFFIAAALTIGIFSALKMRDAITLVLVAFFIALALNPAVEFFTRHLPGKRRGIAIAVVLIIAVGLVGSLLFATIPPVVKETTSFAKSLPTKVNDLRYRNKHVTNFISKYKLDDDISSVTDSFKSRFGKVGDTAVNGVSRVGSSIITTLTTIVMAILMLTGGPKLLERFSDKVYLDDKTRKRHELIAGKMYGVVTGYVNGQLLVALIAACFSLGALTLLHIPYPLPLAAVVFTFGLIPLIGNTLAAIIVVLAAVVLKSVPAGVIILAYFILYQQIENVTLQPIVQGKTTQLPPLIIFMSVILGVALMGPIGGLFAIPAAGCTKILLADYLDHRTKPSTSDSPKNLMNKLKAHIS